MSELTTGARCLVIAVKVSDLTYIATHLADSEKPPVAILSPHAAIDQLSVVGALEPGEYGVVGSRVSRYLERVPTPFTVILWPGHDAVQQQFIDQVGGAEGVRILQLAETNEL